MHFHLDVAGSVATLAFQEGFLDDREVRTLRESVRALTKEGNTRLVVDLADATHVNSVLIGAMVEIYTSYSKLGRQVLYARPRESTQRLFHMLKLDQVFAIFPSIEEARDCLTAPDALLRETPEPGPHTI